MIWCVEDDAAIRDIVIYTLKSTGFRARGFGESSAFFAALQEEKPRLILLDIMLPDMDGVEILQKLKRDKSTCDIPVIMATAKGTEFDKVQSLDLGADDYLVKPFGMMEMVSRVKAVLRRSEPKEAGNLLRFGELTVNLDARTVFLGEESLSLTYKEFELLRLFLSNPGRAFTRDQLYSSVWGDDFVGETRTVDMHIRTLRQKLGAYSGMIKTVRNVGYRMETEL